LVRHRYDEPGPEDVTVDDSEWLASRFEDHRGHLRAVAYRMLGSGAEADDAVQEAWLRLRHTDTSDVRNMVGWLTTVVAHVCLDMLRSRTARREEPQGVHLPDPVVGPAGPADGADPEHEVVLAESVGLALLVVLDTLAPAERLAFVLHDMFAVPFAEIAAILDRSPTAARQLASRARRRVQGAAMRPATDLARQREVVSAFMAAAHDGDFDALVAVLDPDVVLHAEQARGVTKTVRGAAAVAGNALAYRRTAGFARMALVDGALGLVHVVDGRLVSMMNLTIVDGRVVKIDILADPLRLDQVEVVILDD
jgi:RNA polymerase sigma-70 factor (ECF subfamily)